MHPDDGAGGVQQVEVEVGVAGNGAVQTGLQEGRPLLLQDALGAAAIALAHPGHAGHHHLGRFGGTGREGRRRNAGSESRALEMVFRYAARTSAGVTSPPEYLADDCF